MAKKLLKNSPSVESKEGDLPVVPFYPIPSRFKKDAHVSEKEYQKLYAESVKSPEKFWEKQALKRIDWFKKWNKTLQWDYSKGVIKWFQGGKLNVSYNCLDRHLAKRGGKKAILWEGDEPGDTRSMTYQGLYTEVCRFANVLKSLGVKKGDRVAIYLPMVPEAAVAMLACARIGAVHSVIFAGFSAQSIKDRVLDSQCKILITANEGLRGAKVIPLKETVDTALEGVECIEKVIVYHHTHTIVPMKSGRDLWWHQLMAKAEEFCEPEWMDAEDPLFILYTSGSTGKPKGALHTQGGYILYASMTHKLIFDLKEDDIHFCTADVGWVTGHSYVVYGPLANGATTLMFESVPTYPNPGRYWDVVDRHKVTIFYTAPTAIRAIAKEGDEWVKKYKLNTLRVLGSVGEPINRDAWEWYNKVVGKNKCAIVDTWWQTETGGILITPLPGAIRAKPGAATLPFFGVQPCLVDEKGEEIFGNGVKGRLCIKFPWPGQMRTVYGDHKRFIETYFSQFKGKYFTGDGATRDQDGYYWITGRVDDVLNVSGHRLGTAEIESAIITSGVVAEAAVVGMPHEIKGVGIYAYYILKEGIEDNTDTHVKIKAAVRKIIGPIATPDVLHAVPGLPKTRSGKIMRRILRKIAEGELKELGDISTLADPSVVEKIIQSKKV